MNMTMKMDHTKKLSDRVKHHYIHLNEGKFNKRHDYFSNKKTISALIKHLEDNTDKFDHIVFYAHGGLNSAKKSAERINHFLPVFYANRIYPIHIMIDVGFMKSVLQSRKKYKGVDLNLVKRKKRGVAKFVDKIIATNGAKMWRYMKLSAHTGFTGKYSDGRFAINEIFNKIGNAKKVHMVGHSLGAQVHSGIVNIISNHPNVDKIETCSLFGAAMKVAEFNKTYQKALDKNHIKDLTLYNLHDHVECQFNEMLGYPSSLLYMIDEVFRDEEKSYLVGLQKHNHLLDTTKINIIYSDKDSKESTCTNHNDFDNDTTTLNHTLERILGEKPLFPFEGDYLEY